MRTSTTGPTIRVASSSTPATSGRSTIVISRRRWRSGPASSAGSARSCRPRRFAPRPMLVMHGDEDDSVPVSDARQLVNAHGSAELSLFEGAGHRLRHDPRAVAVLLGWLDRMRSTHVHPSAQRV